MLKCFCALLSSLDRPALVYNCGHRYMSYQTLFIASLGGSVQQPHRDWAGRMHQAPPLPGAAGVCENRLPSCQEDVQDAYLDNFLSMIRYGRTTFYVLDRVHDNFCPVSRIGRLVWIAAGSVSTG